MSTGVGSPFRSFSPFESLEVGKRLTPVAVTSGPFTLGPCRALLVGSGGTMNGYDATSTYFLNAPIQTGWNPVSIQEISSGTAAAAVFAVY